MLDKLKNHIPQSIIEELPGIKECKTVLRMAHFLAQCSHESIGFTRTTENTNYSSSGLRNVFKSRFTEAEAVQYAHKPIAIANRAYANRNGNGDEQSGDGNNFKGRGYIQLTGRNNYKAFGESIGVDLIDHPDLVASKYPLASAGWFFDVNHLWSLCDTRTVKDITRCVNGGSNGLSERIALFKKFIDILK